MEVKLNKNGWHWRLQNYVFRNPPRYPSLCPYFWLTNFCILVTFIIPVVPLWKAFRWLVVTLIEGCENFIAWIDRAICQPMYDDLVKRLPDYEVVDGWLESHGWSAISEMSEEDQRLFRNKTYELQNESYKIRHKRRDKFERWQAVTPDWKEKLEAYTTKRKTYLAELEKEREEASKRIAARAKIEAEKKAKNAAKIAAAAIRKQKMFNNIVKYTKMITPFLIGALLVLVLYLVGSFFYWIYTKINWVAFGKGAVIVLQWSSLTILCLAVFVTITFLVTKLIKKCKMSVIEIPGLKYIIWPFVQFWKGLCWIGGKLDKGMKNYFLPIVIGIGKGFQFFGQYLSSTKDNYCPHIDWIEEDEKN